MSPPSRHAPSYAPAAVRWRRRGAAALATMALCAVSLLAASATSNARTIAATDTAHLHLVSSPGSLLLEEGSASGTLPGRLRVWLDVGPTVTARFVIATRSGRIDGHGAGKLHGSGLYASFGGWLKITGGSGRYAHAKGSGGLYGTINRRTDAMTVQTTGKLSF
jgi:hypothetical protein